MPRPRSLTLDDARPLSRDEAAANAELRALLEGPPRTMSVFDGKLTVDGDLSLDEHTGTGLLVAGDLHVRGSVVNLGGSAGRSLVVMGKLKADNLIAGGAEVVVCGATTVKNTVLGHDNDGILKLLGGVKAKAVICLDHHIELEGPIEATTVNERGTLQRPDFDDAVEEALRPELVTDEWADEDAIIDHILGGRSPLKRGAVPTRIRVEKAIRAQAKAGPLHRLDLSEQNLPDVPAVVFELSNLRELDLHDNKIEGLPADLSGWSALEVLDLSNNWLRSLPEAFGRLPALKVLRITYSGIECLPPLAMPVLTHLYTGGNQQRLGGPLGDLPALEHLQTRAVDEAPADIGSLPALRRLVLEGSSNRRLSAFPEVVCELTELEQLSLNGNILGRVPDRLLDLQRLVSLDLGCTLGTVEGPLPDLSQLPALRTLNFDGFRGNSYDTLPPPSRVQEIRAVRTLRELRLCRWSSTSYPRPGGTPGLELDDGYFEQMTELRHLDLSFNAMTRLPESLFQCDLEHLDLRYHQLDETTMERVRSTWPDATIRT